MKSFIGKDFLLSTPSAQTLYDQYAQTMPIIDYHCHVDPKEIYEDRRFENIYQAWLEGDHYKWRLMRSNGIHESFVTGDAPEREKFQKFAETLPRAMGNPMYHWCHMELQAYLGYDGVLNANTAQEVWELSVKKFAEPQMGARGIIEQSGVFFVGTTDDPTSDLQWHRKLRADNSFQPIVAPSFRPDRALNIEKESWQAYLSELGRSAGVDILSLTDLEQALEARMDMFAELGCRASDHGLDYIPYVRLPRQEVDAIMAKALRGESVSSREADAFKTHLLLFCSAKYTRKNWVMQLHYNCMRNPNTTMLEQVGPDSGFDCMNNVNCSGALYALLNALYGADALPRTVLYSLNPGENELLGTALGAFQGTEVPGKLQHGSAWWFNDNKTGMTAQLISLANQSVLGNFIGMLTDSRSFLSYTRHSYFRRILCELVGGWVENGEYPADMESAGQLIQDICHNNAKRYFGI